MYNVTCFKLVHVLLKATQTIVAPPSAININSWSVDCRNFANGFSAVLKIALLVHFPNLLLTKIANEFVL